MSSASRIEYSEKYADDLNEYRWVILDWWAKGFFESSHRVPVPF